MKLDSDPVIERKLKVLSIVILLHFHLNRKRSGIFTGHRHFSGFRNADWILVFFLESSLALNVDTRRSHRLDLNVAGNPEYLQTLPLKC